MTYDENKELKILVQFQEHQTTVFTAKVLTDKAQATSLEDYENQIKEIVKHMMDNPDEPIEVVICGSPQDAQKRFDLFVHAYLGDETTDSVTFVQSLK